MNMHCYAKKRDIINMLRTCVVVLKPFHFDRTRYCRTDRDVRLTNKAYLSAITVTNISQSIYLQDGTKNQLALIWNKIMSLSLYV